MAARDGLTRGNKARKPVPSRRPRRTVPPPSARGPADWSNLDPDDLKHPALYINRELSWLEFNQRVLAQAEDAYHPFSSA